MSYDRTTDCLLTNLKLMFCPSVRLSMWMLPEMQSRAHVHGCHGTDAVVCGPSEARLAPFTSSLLGCSLTEARLAWLGSALMRESLGCLAM